MHKSADFEVITLLASNLETIRADDLTSFAKGVRIFAGRGCVRHTYMCYMRDSSWFKGRALIGVSVASEELPSPALHPINRLGAGNLVVSHARR